MAKIKSRTLRITGAILLVVVAFVLAFNSIVAGLIEQKLNDFLLKEDLKHYHVEYKRVGFNFLNRSVSLIGFKYIPDSAYLDSLDKADVAIMVPSVAVRRLTVSGVDFLAALEEGKLLIKKISVKKPEILLYKFTGKASSSPYDRKKVSLHDSVKLVKLSGVYIYTISLKKCKLSIFNYKKKKFTLTSQNIAIRLDGLQLEKSPYSDHYFYPALQDATLLAKNNTLQLGNNLYEIAFDKLFVDLKGDSLIFQGFHYRPLYSKAAFSKHIRFQKERFDLKAKQIAFSGADFYLFLTRGKIFIRKIGIDDAFIDLYRDKRVPFNHNQRPLLPHQSIKRVKGKFDIDTVALQRVRFVYSEKMNERKVPLKVYFTQLSGYLSHITNVPALWRKNNMQVGLKGRFMGRAPLRLRFVFPLAAKSDTFYFNGAIYGPVPFAVFNPAIYPAAGLKFAGGTLDRIVFNGGANPIYAAGTMTMLYRNLNIQAMKKDAQTSNKFMSWGINSLVRKNNPRKGEGKHPKQVAMFYERDMERGFGNFFWKTLYSGMKATMILSVNNINRKNRQSVTGKKPDTKKQKSKDRK